MASVLNESTGEKSGRGASRSSRRNSASVSLASNSRKFDAQAQVVWQTLHEALRALLPPDDAKVDLPFRQFRVCMALWMRQDVATMTELSREAGVSLSALTQIANRLERAGLVERAFSGTDRRVRCLKLSAEGDTLLRTRNAAQLQLLGRSLDLLEASEVSKIIEALGLLAAAAKRARENEQADNRT